MRRQPNARFWLWWFDGWVKITLRPGQELSCARSDRDYEGWNLYAETFRFDGEIVERETVSDGSDCDGRLTDGYTSFCPVDRLRVVDQYDEWWDSEQRYHFASVYVNGEQITTPEWHAVAHSHRDYQAEAAGY